MAAAVQCSVILKKSVLPIFDEFFRHACKYEMIAKFVKTTIVHCCIDKHTHSTPPRISLHYYVRYAAFWPNFL